MRSILIISLLILASIPVKSEARPRAVAGEPEITREGENYLGGGVYLQRLELPDQIVSYPARSIAETYYLLGGEGTVFTASRIRYLCKIGADGSVALTRDCSLKEGVSAQAMLLARFGFVTSSPPKYPELRAIEEPGADRWVLHREAEFDVLLPAVTAPTLDLNSGPLVSHDDVDLGQGSESALQRYPLLAVRMGLEAQMLCECQIQTDLSVVCHSKQYFPAHAQSVFERDRGYQRGFNRLRSAAVLKNGEDARGVRFNLALTWRLNEEASE